MHPLQAELSAILADAQQRAIALVVLGAFAVRTYLREPDQRFTHDLDLLTPTDALPALGELLTSRGYHVYRSAPWWRAERGTGKDRILVDIAAGSVVDMSSFESYPLSPSEARERAEPGGAPIPVPPLEDLLAMKILAHRDKDILDVVALLRDAGDALDEQTFGHAINRPLASHPRAAPSSLPMKPPRYFVDARRSVPFDTVEEAKDFARQNFPAVILERVDREDGSFAWEEILRFDWRWDPARSEPVIDFG